MSGQPLKRLLNLYSRSSVKKQQSRYLTIGEIALARSVFGDRIRLDEVRLKTTWWVLKSYAVSPNGNIYFNPADWITDFSVASLGKQSWLIHELTHVWQLQQGLKVVRGALIDRRYDYVLETGKSFFKYGIEQQARMVQDYFVRRQKGQDCQDLEACIPFLTVNTITDKKRANSNFTA
ncbi:type IV secretion protein Rhs [Psychrobacter sp. C 20.9]|uniref:type IV secretion protein Rhs n=1 Tax=Psychrobacter sp. C 20.9 TaxID=1926477 RepID=UPI000946CC36|nr:type IV secretion protein Rhs [Psychrobacter sp. C 20.9]OLF38752.1 type IV secretion protein Rhs [Psychrobacter sp. C 20.9]